MTEVLCHSDSYMREFDARVVETTPKGVGLDLQADGGTHVANTRDVGRIRVVGHESKGRINKRLRIEVS
jgi:Ser-tRNA(Ala) deacylase AlaX